MTIYRFNVPGEARGKGRPRFVNTPNGPRTYTDSETKGYQNLVRSMASLARVKMIDGPVSVTIRAGFEIPKSATKTRQTEMRAGLTWPTKKPDTDNIGKSILDALNGLAFKDDAQVVELIISKHWADEPSVSVEVKPLVEVFAKVEAA